MFDGWDLVSDTAQGSPAFQLIQVAGRRFAVDRAAAVAVIDPRAATQVPGAPPWVRGVILWEGQVVPVVATAQRLGLEALAGAAGGRLLQLEVGGDPFFLEVESLGEVINTIELERSDEPLVLGFIEVGGESVPVLDLKIITDISDQEDGR